MKKEEIIKIINKKVKKYRDYYSDDCICRFDGGFDESESFTSKNAKDNGWWINLEDFDDFINELKDEVVK